MIFIDTSGVYACLDRRDIDHPAAANTWAALINSGAMLITHNYVLLEAEALIQRRIGLAAAAVFHYDIVPALSVSWIDQRLHDTAVAMVLSSDRRMLSLVDSMSFLVMRELGITRAFTFDRHFTEQGFELLPRLVDPS